MTATASISRRELSVGLLAFIVGCIFVSFLDRDHVATAPVIRPAAGAGLADPDSGESSAVPKSTTVNGLAFTPLDHDALEKKKPDLRRRAIVSMASNDETGQLAMTLFQSLRDGNTQVPRLILLLARGGTGSIDCQDGEWKKSKGRDNVRCDGPDTIPGEIVSERFLAPMRDKLGVELVVIDPLPETPYTRDIPGGRATFWGKALDKLQVFNATSIPLDSTDPSDAIESLLWMDSDDYVVNGKNVDHLFNYPAYSGSLVTACAHSIGPAYFGGGIWHVKPSKEIFNDIMGFISHPVPGTMNEGWNLGDMQVIRHFFSEGAPYSGSVEPLYPAINDLRCGYVPGLKKIGQYRGMSDQEFRNYLEERLDARKPRVEGCIPNPASLRPSWTVFPIYLDQCVGSFAADPGRMAPLEQLYSVHFSCLQNIDKPSRYYSQGGEKALFEAMRGADRHSQFWFRKWYATWRRAMAKKDAGPEAWKQVRFPEPLYAGDDGIEEWPAVHPNGRE